MVSPEFADKIAIYWFSEGFGHLEKFWAPTDKKKMEKRVANFIFRCGFKKHVFVKNGAIAFRLRPLVPHIGAVRTLKT